MAQQLMPGSNTKIKDLIPGNEMQADIKDTADSSNGQSFYVYLMVIGLLGK